LTRKVSEDYKSLEVETGQRRINRTLVDAHGTNDLAICPKTGSTGCIIGRPGSRGFPRNVCKAYNESWLTWTPLSSTFTVTRAHTVLAGDF